MLAFRGSGEAIARSYMSREVRPLGFLRAAVEAGHFQIAETAISAPAYGQLALRNHWFPVSSSTRLMAEASTQEVKSVLFPPLKPGTPLAAGEAGVVMRSGLGSNLR